MRNLTLNETLSINGAGYAEDIVATAATLYVGSSLYGIGLGAAKAFCTFAVTMECITPLVAAVSLASPVIALAAPAAVASLVLAANPQFETALTEKFHSYFG